MSRTPLQTLSSLARETRNRAGQLLAGEQQNRRQLAEQLELLKRYRQEYASQLRKTMDQGMELPSLQDYQDFLFSLDRAISRAQSRLHTQDSRVSQCRRQWQDAQYQLHSFDALTERRQARERQMAQRHEQREHDEISSNMYRPHPQNHTQGSGSEETI